MWQALAVSGERCLWVCLWQMWQALAVSGESCLWVCLCRDRLELVANCFPHSKHSCFCLVPPDSLDLPSLWCNESTVKDLMLCCKESIVKDLLEGLKELKALIDVSGREMSE